MSSSPSVPSAHSRSNIDDEAKDQEPLNKKPRNSELQSHSQSLVDDLDHASLNEQVIRNALLMFGENPTTAGILREVISSCPVLNQDLAARTEKIYELLAKEPKLEALVKDAWLKKDFTQIRRLAILQKNPDSNTRGGRTKHEWPLRSLRTKPYIGKSHMLLLDSVHRMNYARRNKSMLYENGLTIIQSSGTGKSRMVHEMARRIFTIPFNIRSWVETRGGAFPDPDKTIHNHLILQQGRTSEQAQIHYMKFFLGLFSKILEEVRKLPEPSPSDSNNTLARAWFNHLGRSGVRSALYANVVAECEKISVPSSVAGSMDVDSELGSAVLGTAARPPEETNEEFVEFKKRAKNILTRLISLVASKAEMQQSVVAQLSKPAQIVVYIDEAHVLTNVPVEDSRDRTLYTEFTSVVNEFRDYDIFFVFLSTNSNLSQLVPPACLHPSTRVIGGGAALQPPFTELPFDCGDEPFISPNHTDDNAKTFAEVADISFMAQFGRPLWSTRLKADPTLKDDLIRFARAKLIAISDPNANVESLFLSLAVFAVRLLFDFNLSRAVTQSATVRLVESHMAIAFSIPEHREVLRMGYPSEPILAEAAAQQMHSFRMHGSTQESRRLLDLVNDGYIDKGERGELVARFLVTRAYDQAVETYQTEKQRDQFTKTKHPFYSEGVPLTYFIKALFSDEYAELILKSKPDNVDDGLVFEDAFKDGWVRFLTFQHATDLRIINSLAACGAAARGMGFQCCNDQRFIDQVLPIIFRRHECGKEACLNERDISLMGIQDENTERFRCETETAFSEEDIGFFPEDTTTARPYIALLMNLGGTSDEVPTVNVGDARRFTDCKEGKEGKEGKEDKEDVRVVHPRYSISAYGCSGEVYNGVDDENIFAEILDKAVLLSEHPRQTKNALSALQRLKPSWKEGIDYWHWFRSNILWESES